jgi:hypothetical protein
MYAQRIGRRIQLGLFFAGFACALATCNLAVIETYVAANLVVLTME